jgi:hypothetical protein
MSSAAPFYQREFSAADRCQFLLLLWDDDIEEGLNVIVETYPENMKAAKDFRSLNLRPSQTSGKYTRRRHSLYSGQRAGSALFSSKNKKRSRTADMLRPGIH